MKKLTTALIAFIFMASSTGHAWDDPNNYGGGGSGSYFDIDYGFSPFQYEAFMYNDTLFLYEHANLQPSWPDWDDTFGDIIPRQTFLQLILQCAGLGQYTCTDFNKMVDKCNTGQFVNYNCIDLVERTNKINPGAKQKIVEGCVTIGLCTAPPAPLTAVPQKKTKLHS